MLRRSQLYVPANDRRKVMKSLTIQCDSVILDLEDAVPPDQKEEARSDVADYVTSLDWGRREVCVRINPLSSPWAKAELGIMRKLERLDAIVVPKAEGSLSGVWSQTGKKLIPIVETAMGLVSIDRVVSSRGAVAVAYGAADFALSVGGSVSEYMRNVYVKSKIAVHAAAAGIDAVDNVFFDLNDMAGFRRDAELSRALGFSGKQVIHPSQVEVANEVFSPTTAEIEWAEEVSRSYERARKEGKGAVRLDDSLVDAVHARIARRILEWRDSASSGG